MNDARGIMIGLYDLPRLYAMFTTKLFVSHHVSYVAISPVHQLPSPSFFLFDKWKEKETIVILLLQKKKKLFQFLGDFAIYGVHRVLFLLLGNACRV